MFEKLIFPLSVQKFPVFYRTIYGLVHKKAQPHSKLTKGAPNAYAINISEAIGHNMY